MPPEEEDLNSDKIKKLIDILKTHNSELYESLINSVGASEQSLEKFIVEYENEQSQHDADLTDILRASEGVNAHLERDLDKFISEFTQYAEKHHRDTDVISNLTSNLASEMQKRISKIQTNLGRLGNATNLSISNMTSLIGNLSDQYSSMAKASKVAIKTATLDSSQIGGRSVADGLVVEVSNIGDFNSAISEASQNLSEIDTKIEQSGDYAKKRRSNLENDQLDASHTLGVIEGRKLAEAAAQDMNGNFMNMSKTADKTAEAFKQVRKYMTDGTSHLARQVDFSQDIATLTAKRVTSLAAIDQTGKGITLEDGTKLSGLTEQMDAMQEFKKMVESGGVEAVQGHVIEGMGAKLSKEQEAAENYLKKNLPLVEQYREELIELANESGGLQDKLQNLDPNSEQYAKYNSELETIQDTMKLLGEEVAQFDAVKLIKVGIDEQLLNRDVFVELEDSIRNLKQEEIDIDMNMSALDEYQDLLTRLASPGVIVEQSEIKRIVDKVQGQGFKVGGGGPSGLAGGISSEQYARESKLLAEQQKDFLDLKAEIDAKKNEATQKATAASERILGTMQGTIDQTKENLKYTDEALENAKKSQELHNQAVKSGVWSDSIIKQVDTFKDKILDVVGKIPLMGESLKATLETPLNEVNEKIQDIVVDGIGGIASEIAEKSKEGTLTVAEQTGIIKNGFADMANQISGLTSMMTGLLSPAIIGAAALLALLGAAVMRFLELDQQTEEFNKGVGLGIDQTEEIVGIVRTLNVEFATMGVSLEVAFGAAQALTETFGTLVMATKENIKLVSLLAENHAVSNENAAGALDVLTRVGDGTAESARNAMNLAVGMSRAAGVPLDKVMEDVAGASDETLALIRGSTKELIHASVEARRLGVSLETLSGAASHMLDFESSIRSEMEASVFAGRHLSFAKSRQLAFEGDIVGMQKASLETIKQAGEWTEMSYFQQKKLAEAAGMTVGEIGTQLTREKQLEALKNGTAKQQEMYNNYLQMQKDLEDGNTKSLAEQGEELLKQELMQSKMNELKESFNSMMIELGEKLLPLVEVGFALIVPLVDILLETAKLILMPFTLLSDIVRALTGDFSGLSARFGSFGDIAYTTLGLIIGSVVLLKTKLLGIGPLLGSLGSGVIGIFKGGTTALGGLLGGLKNFFTGGETGVTNLGSKFKDVFGGLKDNLKNVFSKDAESASEGFFTNVKNKVKGMFGGGDAPEIPGPLKKDGTPDKRFKANRDALKPSVTDVSKNSMPDVDTDKGGKGVTSFAEKFNSIDMKKILQGAAALLVLSGALWVSAKAFQEFGEVTWGGVLKGVVALGTLVAGLYAIGQVMDKNANAILKGSGALAAIGVALLPAAYSFQLFSDVDWGGFMVGVGALTALVGAAFVLGKIMATGIGAKVLLAGAAAVALLGAAMIPAAIAMEMMSEAFLNYVDAINTMEWSSIGKIATLAAVFTVVGSLAPVIMLGAAAMMVMSGAVAILAVGVSVLSDGVSQLGPAIVSLGDSAGSLIAFAGAVSLIGLVAPLVLLGAVALSALGIAMIPVAAASILIGAGFSLIANSVSELDSVNLVGLVMEMGAAFALLGLIAPVVLVGAASLSIMTLALIPFSAALLVAGAGMAMFGMGLEMTIDSLKDAPEAAAGLLAFVGAVSLIALVSPLILIGSAALAALGIGLAILAVPLLVVSGAMYVLGGAMKLMADAVESMADSGAIGIIFGLGAAFTFLAVTFPLIALGALSMTLMTLALLPLSAALFTAGLGMQMLSNGIKDFKPALEDLSGSTSLVLEFIDTVGLLALASPAFILAGIAMTMMSIGATLLGTSLLLLSLGLNAIEEPLTILGGVMIGVVTSLAQLGEVGPGLISASIGVMMLAGALGLLGLSMLAYSAMSIFFTDADPIEKFIRLGKIAPELEKVSSAFGTFSRSIGSIGDVGDTLEDTADGLEDLFEIVEDVPTSVGKKMHELGIGMKAFFASFGAEFLAFSVVGDLEDSLEGLADGIEDLFEVIEDVDVSIAPNLSIIGDGMKGLLGAFTGGALMELNEDVDDILEGLGDGIGEFFEGLEDVDPAIIPTLGMIGPGVAQLLVALGTEGLADFDTDLEDVFEGLGDGIGEFMSSIEGFDAEQILAMSGMGDAIAKILTGLGGIGEIDFDADDFEDVLESVGAGVESLFEPMRNMDDDLLEAARSVGGVLSGLFSNLGTIGEVGDDWDDVFEGFGEGVEAMFDELNDIDRKDLKMAVLVGDVLGDLFSAFEGINLTEDLGDAVGNLGDGIEDLFDEIEHIDEDSMALASTVGRVLGRFFRSLPLDLISQINADSIGDQLNELGYGIYELFYEMDVTDFEDDLQLMQSVGLSIKQVVLPIIETDLSAIPKDVGSILNNLGDGIYDLFDEMDDLGGEEEALKLMSGMGGFGQMLQGVAAISDTRVDMTALQEIADSMRTIIVAVSDIYSEMENEDAGALATVSEGKTQNTVDAIVERMKGLGEGVRAMIDGFGDIDLLKELAGLDIGGMMSGITNAVRGISELVNPETFGREFETESDASDYYAQLAVSMAMLGEGMKSIIGAFSDIDTLDTLTKIDFDGVMKDMKDGIKGMMRLTEWGWYVGDEQEETDYYEQISKRMQSLGTGIKSIVSSFSNIGSLDGIDIEDISESITDGISTLLNDLEDVNLSSLPVVYKISDAMQTLLQGMSNITQMSGINVEDIMEDISCGIEDIMSTLDDIDPASLSKLEKLSEAMSTMSISSSGIDVAFNGLKSLASQEFVDGLSRATSAIYDFANALLALNNVNEIDGDIIPTNDISLNSDAQTTTDFDQLARYSGGAFGKSEANTPMVVETIASVGQTSGSDMSNVEAKLSELIGLMKSGGIAVNLDGKKVHKGLASSIEKNPIG